MRARHLLHHHQLLAGGAVDGEGRRAAGDQPRVGGADPALEILGMKIAAADEDQVLEPAGDEKLRLCLGPSVEETNIAGAQPALAGPGPGDAGTGCRAQRVGGFARMAPVAAGHRRTANPDLPHPLRGARDPPDRVHHPQPVIERRPAAGDEPLGRGRLGRRRLDPPRALSPARSKARQRAPSRGGPPLTSSVASASP